MTTKFKFLVSAGVTGQNDIKRLGNSLQGVQGKAKNLGMAVKGAGLAFKALFATAAVGSIIAIGKSAIDTADAFGKLSTRTGIAADKLLAYVNAGKLADVSQSDLETGLRTLARTQVEASEGVKTYADAYAKLGVTVKNQDGTLKNSDQLLSDIADRFQDLPNGPEKAAVAMDIFGRSGQKMITMLNGGSEALEEFGFELSENFARNSETFNDNLTKVGIEMDRLKMQVLDDLLPALIDLSEGFLTLTKTIRDGADAFAKFFGIGDDAMIAKNTLQIQGINKALAHYRKTLKDMRAETSPNFARQGVIEEIERTVVGLERRRDQLRSEINLATTPTSIDVETDDPLKTRFKSVFEDDKSKDKSNTGKEIVKMSQDEFDLRQAILDAREAENEVGLIAAKFALKEFEIGSQFNNDVLGGRIALREAELSKNQALMSIERERAAAAKQAAEEAAAAQQALLEAGPGHQMRQQLEELIKLENQVAAGATAIGNAFGNSFKSVIDGSKTAEQALGDMMASVAEHFLDMAAQIIAKQIAMIIYGTIMKALGVGLGGGASSVPSSAYGDMSVAGPSFFQGGMISGYAEGGYVSGPTTALVGEGGQGEYIIPEDRMRESMARYSRGARGSAVIPENGASGTSGTSGEAGGAAVAAPIDVRFSVERINEVDYVTAEQFQAGMQRAAQQGAVEGERRALGSIRNSSAVRRRIGV